jgi:hypothetical protein
MFLARVQLTVREDGRQRRVYYCVEREAANEAVQALLKRVAGEADQASIFTSDLFPIALSGRIEVALVAN